LCFGYILALTKPQMLKRIASNLWVIVLMFFQVARAEPLKKNLFSIATFQWTPGHPVRAWLEGIGPQGRNPLYEGKISESTGLTPLKRDKSILNIGLPNFVLEKVETPISTRLVSERFPQAAVIEWLKTSQSEGAVEVWFRFVGPVSGESFSPSPERGMAELARLLSTGRSPPPPMQFSFPTNFAISNAQSEPVRPYMVSLVAHPKITDPLLIQTCQYLDKWLNSLAILSSSIGLNDRKVLFECDFTLPLGTKGSDVIRKNSLKFTRLTLPLFDKHFYRFDVIQTELDLKSISALSVLRKADAGSVNVAE
jgi:hypothetical protein